MLSDLLQTGSKEERNNWPLKTEEEINWQTSFLSNSTFYL
jgi:hypothetical protein